jgi:hypothetical protein
VNLAVALVVVDDFGIGWDETADAAYGRVALNAYQEPEFDWDRYGKRKYYGPAHFMFQQLVTDVAGLHGPQAEPLGLRLANVLTFQVAILALYFLARNFMGAGPSLIAACLFAGQPLLFGHAFINGKDTPFMAFFLLAMSVGLAGLKRLPGPPGSYPEAGSTEFSIRSLASQDWRSSARAHRITVLLLLAVVGLGTLTAIAPPEIVYAPIHGLVRAAYTRHAPAILNDLFDRVAQHANELPVDEYTLKATRLTDRVVAISVAVLTCVLGLATARVFQRTRRALWFQARDVSPLEWIRTRYWWWLVGSGIAIGVLLSIRSVGFLAPLLVGLMHLWRRGVRSLAALLAIGSFAALVTYSTWPFLWQDPFGRFLESVQFLAGNPNKDYVLYMGEVTKGRLLPWHYLPVLMILQFSEPVWLAAILGVLALALGRTGNWTRWQVGLLIGLWLAAPTVPLILRKAWFYDNFRQFLFVTPVFFLLAGLGMELTFRWIRRPSVRGGLCMLLLAPGVAAILRLHPYEYVYYNSLVGGVRGAARRFELDYWATSYTAAIRLLNQTAPPGEAVAFLGTMGAAIPYAREDLVLSTYTFDEDPSRVQAGILVSTTRANADIDLQRFTDPIAQIEIDGVPLAVIRQK